MLTFNSLACGNQMLRRKEFGSTESKWSTLATAVSENSTARCTATIGKRIFEFLTFQCLEIINRWCFDTVAPQWALASYSCLFGNAVSTSSLPNEISWTLQVGGNDENTTQKLNIDRIYTYPQVNYWKQMNGKCVPDK